MCHNFDDIGYIYLSQYLLSVKKLSYLDSMPYDIVDTLKKAIAAYVDS